MPVDLKHEFARPLALILSALAALGWVLFGLSSWSTASVQKTQRLQIIEATEKSDRLAAELSRQVAASGTIADLEKKMAATRDDLTRMTQAKSDIQTDLAGAQRSLTALRRDVSDASRNLQSQTEKMSELQANAGDQAVPAPEVAEPRVGRGSRGSRRWSRRGRSSRSFSIVSRRR